MILGNAPFIAEPYFGHRSRLYDLDLHRNPDAIADIIIESYNHGVRAINLVNDDALKLLLIKRYMSNKTFEQIAYEMNYSYMHICRLHGRALQEIQKML